jgi:hypothetical protein
LVAEFLPVRHWLHSRFLVVNAPLERFLDQTLGANGYEPVVRLAIFWASAIPR